MADLMEPPRWERRGYSSCGGGGRGGGRRCRGSSRRLSAAQINTADSQEPSHARAYLHFSFPPSASSLSLAHHILQKRRGKSTGLGIPSLCGSRLVGRPAPFLSDFRLGPTLVAESISKKTPADNNRSSRNHPLIPNSPCRKLFVVNYMVY